MRQAEISFELQAQAGDWRSAHSGAVDVPRTKAGSVGSDDLEGGLIEVLLNDNEPLSYLRILPLLAPMLGRITREQRWIAHVAPPSRADAQLIEAAGINSSRMMLVYPRLGRDGLGAVAKCLQASTVGAVLAHMRDGSDAELAALDVCAKKGRSLAIIFRPADCVGFVSKALMRLQVGAGGGSIYAEQR